MAGKTRKKKRQRRRLLARLAILAVIMMGIAVWQARPLYRVYKRYKAEQKIEASKKAEKLEDWEAAYRRAAEAYKLAPEAEETLRQLAELTAKLVGDPGQAIYFLQRLAELGYETPSDRRLWVDVLLRSGKVEEARVMAEALVAENVGGAEGAENLGRMASIYLRMGDAAAAERALNRALELDPGNATIGLAYAQIMTESPFSEVQSQGWDMMWKRSEDGGESGLNALRLLAASDRLPASEAETFLQRLRGHPLAGASEELRAATWEIERFPSRRDAVVSRILGGLEGKGPGEAVPYFRWLSGIGESAAVLRYLSLERALSHRDLLSIYINVLADGGRWDDIAEILSGETLPLTEAELHLTKALIAIGRGETDNALIERELSMATQLATVDNNVSVALRAAQLAEDRGFAGTAIQAYRVATNNPSTAKGAFGRLFEIAKRSRDTEMVFDIVKEAERKGAVVPELMDFGVYLRLLVGDAIEHNWQRATIAADENPRSSTHQLVYALALHRMHEPEACAEVCATIDEAPLDPGKRAVFAALLTRYGDLTSAARVARTITDTNRSLLLDEEAKIFGL